MDLFWFNTVVLGIVGVIVFCMWLRIKLKRTTLTVHDPSYYVKGDVVNITGTGKNYDGRYKIVKIENGKVTARRTFRP